MTWQIEGTYFENCNCDMVCPCATSGQTLPADEDRCKVALAFHVHKGDGNAVDMSVEDFVSPLDPTGAGVRVSGLGFPADTLAAGQATASTVDVFGLSWDNTGKNSFSAPFAWSA